MCVDPPSPLEQETRENSEVWEWPKRIPRYPSNQAVMLDQPRSRRKVVKIGATALTAPALAGCGGRSNNTTNGGGGGEDTGAPGNGGGGDAKSFDGWFDQTSNYNQVKDLTDSGSVTVEVGAGDNGQLFAPPAVRVSTGTTVTWNWTGVGGSHNVVHSDGKFSSDLTDQEGHTFEHTFQNSGEFRYVCEPHKSVGMRGVVIVE